MMEESIYRTVTSETALSELNEFMENTLKDLHDWGREERYWTIFKDGWLGDRLGRKSSLDEELNRYAGQGNGALNTFASAAEGGFWRRLWQFLVFIFYAPTTIQAAMAHYVSLKEAVQKIQTELNKLCDSRGAQSEAKISDAAGRLYVSVDDFCKAVDRFYDAMPIRSLSELPRIGDSGTVKYRGDQIKNSLDQVQWCLKGKWQKDAWTEAVQNLRECRGSSVEGIVNGPARGQIIGGRSAQTPAGTNQARTTAKRSDVQEVIARIDANADRIRRGLAENHRRLEVARGLLAQISDTVRYIRQVAGLIYEVLLPFLQEDRLARRKAAALPGKAGEAERGRVAREIWDFFGPRGLFRRQQGPNGSALRPPEFPHKPAPSA